MQTRTFLKWLGLGAGGLFLGVPRSRAAERPPARAGFNVRDFGASGTGQRLDTAALQAALDACARAGGGTVLVPAGTYLTGTLRLRSRVTLHLDAGATLLGSPRLDDYPPIPAPVRSYTDHYTERSLLYGENLERVGLEGRGVLNGQGAAFKGPYKLRPYLLRLVACRDVAVTGLTFQDSPMWVQHYLACEDVRLDGLLVRSRCNANNDGLDLDGCERVRVAHCDIVSGDDAIVLKSTLDRPCRRVVITNCLLRSDCNALKLGTESNGGFQDIAISNCVIYDTRLAGLAVELVDGGLLDRVSVSNLTLHNTRGALFIRLGDRGRPFREGQARPAPGRLRRVSIRDVQADGADGIGCAITGLPDHPAEDITLENIRIRFAGGGPAPDPRRAVPEHPEKYPEYSMFGVLPAYGFYCRHLRGLRLRHVQVECAQPDGRPSLVCDDVDDVEIAGWEARTTSPQAPVILGRNVRRAFLHGCRGADGAAAFLRVEGAASRELRLAANALADPARAVVLAEDVPPQAVTVDGQPPARP